MSYIVDKQQQQQMKNTEFPGKWIHPWDAGYAEDIYNRDDRFFSLVMKGAMAFLTRTLTMYGKPIKHFIFNTGSSYMYVETNGYDYSVKEVSGEDYMYMERPRCVVTMNQIAFEQAELTQPHVRGNYERLSDGQIKGFNAEMRRMPMTIDLQLQYVLSTFNEEITLAQQLIDKLAFQRYFSIIYLGQTIDCSIEMPANVSIELNKIDMAGSEANNKLMNIQLTVMTNYPVIDEATEMSTASVIASFDSRVITKEKETTKRHVE